VTLLLFMEGIFLKELIVKLKYVMREDEYQVRVQKKKKNKDERR